MKHPTLPHIALHHHFPVLLLYLLALSGPLQGQDTEKGTPPYGQAPIEGADTSSYYSFSVTPSLQKYLQPGNQDLRILDAEGKEIPYLFVERGRTEPFHVVRDLNHVTQKSRKDGSLLLELKDPDPDSIEGLALELDRSSLSRSLSISASEDGNDWEEVVPMRKYHDEIFPDGTKRFIVREAELPPHPYYKVELSGEGAGPDPRIRTVSVIEDRSRWGSYLQIPGPSFEKVEKGKRSYIPLSFDAPTYQVHGIELLLEGPDFFYRHGFIARGDPEKPDSLKKLASFDLVSYEGDHLHATADRRSSVNVRFHFEGFSSNELVLVIEDGDHAPLNVQDVRAFQRDRRIHFKTREGQKAERLVLGDPNAKRPDYELPYFEEKMPENVPEARIGGIEWNGPALRELLPEEEKKKKRDQQERRTLTIVGFILAWVLGISVLVAVVILWKRGVL